MELVETYWSFVAVAIAVYLLGEVSKRIAKAIGWRPINPEQRSRAAIFYDATMPVHALIAGALFGLLAFPVPVWVGTDMIARCLYFTLAGALCGQLYEAAKRITYTIAKGEKGTDANDD